MTTHANSDPHASMEAIARLLQADGIPAQIDKSYPNEWRVVIPLADGGYAEVASEPFGELAAATFDPAPEGREWGAYRAPVTSGLGQGEHVAAFVASLRADIEAQGLLLTHRFGIKPDLDGIDQTGPSAETDVSPDGPSL
jgi:hypothetical protein